MCEKTERVHFLEKNKKSSGLYYNSKTQKSEVWLNFNDERFFFLLNQIEFFVTPCKNATDGLGKRRYCE